MEFLLPRSLPPLSIPRLGAIPRALPVDFALGPKQQIAITAAKRSNGFTSQQISISISIAPGQLLG
ncbi:hypothetical protein PF002_g14951 [Phytophthora fragariae]|nr:hypothetical protein PR002_g7816 [Phytophthora rubi]KAE9039389.1 hypothetical protein PR001_g7524 [Phytophthora rubi]KAE9104653.1 hypothetical protein PF007_g13987 [Phytophthora fragariae]KAE9223530.1 hypothetical protein PF002_g14951 [Phytophthora fragariae]KAE9335327.1 hypothetical protein PF008_g13536 [Phytophthora fragariae]